MILCHEIIWTGQTTSTYCMRERGHPDEGVKGFPGGHSIVNAPPAVPVTTKEAVLVANYGPYAKDDPKATRGF